MKSAASIAKWLALLVYAACAVVIVASVLPIGGWKALDVLTGSMRPGIQPGDLVIIHRVPLRDIHPGDVVTYTDPVHPQQTITHRVVALPVKDGLPMVVTKGDANSVADLPFAGGRIVGREVLHLPMVGKLANILHSPLGLLALIIIPGLLVIWGEIQTLRRSLARKPTGLSGSKSDPPDQEPPAGPPTLAPTETQPTRRSTRRLDGMGPRTLALLILVAVLPVGYTYALTTTNSVKSQGIITVLAAPTSADDCKNGGWQQFKDPDGSPRFKNQGQCVAYVNSNSHSHVSINNSTNVTVVNQSNQQATTGDVTTPNNSDNGASSGDATNSNTTTTTIQ
ncbi:MAG TPA: signal peptidase I [Candidatus Saccharimonadia bacterium]|jgi:signal peptidase